MTRRQRQGGRCTPATDWQHTWALCFHVATSATHTHTHTHTHIHICSLSMLVCNTYTVTTGPRLSCSSDSERECLEVNDIGDFYVSADHQQSIHWHKPLTHFRVCTQGTVNSHCTHATLEIHQQQQPTVQICVEAPFSVQ